jgi:hypothetical protein
MQDDSKFKMTPKNKIAAKKKYFTVKFVHLIYKFRIELHKYLITHLFYSLTEIIWK